MALRFGVGSRDYLRTLAPRVRRDLRRALQLMEGDPRHAKLDLKLLQVKAGGQRIFRAHVGAYRIVFSPRPDHTYVIRIIHRSEGYGWLERMDPSDLVS